MAKISLRFGLLMLFLFGMSFAANESWVDLWVQTTVGQILYWSVTIAMFLFLIFGIYLPWMDHLSTKDTATARLMSNWYRKWKRR